jgi:DNA-binding Lrp family transcriptional regulator
MKLFKTRHVYLIFKVCLLEVAFVLITVEPGKERDVLNALKTMPEVKEAHRVYGIYDTIARVETEDIKYLVIKIRRVNGVRSTLTMIAL